MRSPWHWVSATEMFSMTAELYNLQGTLTTIGPFGHYNLSMEQAHRISCIFPRTISDRSQQWKKDVDLFKGLERTSEINLERNYLLCIWKMRGFQGNVVEACPRSPMFPPFPTPLVAERVLWVVKASELGAEVTQLTSGHRVFCTYDILQHSLLPSQEQGRSHVEMTPGLLS